MEVDEEEESGVDASHFGSHLVEHDAVRKLDEIELSCAVG